ncbi:MAG: hypothetical protein ACRDKE_01435, partial [Solirubrobacterales bacterium]
MGIINAAVNRPFIPCDDLAIKLDLPYFASLRWSSVLFKRGASPYDATDLHSSYLVATSDTVDLIRNDYSFAGAQVMTLESAVFVYAEVRGPSGQTVDLNRASEWCEMLFDVPNAPSFTIIRSSGRVFSSAGSLEIEDMTTWSDRIDGVLRSDGAVGFLILKVHVDFDDLYR